MKKVLFLFLIPLSGCAITPHGLSLFDDSVKVEHSMVAIHFILPESNGKSLSGKAQLAVGGGAYAKLISDIDSTTYNTDPSLSSGINFNFLFDMAIIKRIDVVYNSGPGVKLQIWGPTRQDAKQGDFSISLNYNAVTVDTTITSEDSTGDIKKAEAKIKGHGNQYAMSFGRRVSSDAIFYGGPFYSETKVSKVHLYQTNNTNYTVEEDAVVGGKGSIYGLSLGIFTEKKDAFWGSVGYSMGLEVAYSHAEWKKTFPTATKIDVAKDSGHIGGILGLTW